MQVTSKISHASARIFINEVLHLHIVRERFLGLSSWLYEREGMYYIEIALNGGRISVDYDRRDLWVGVLAELEKIR
jgi:hypothetical protein